MVDQRGKKTISAFSVMLRAALLFAMITAAMGAVHFTPWGSFLEQDAMIAAISKLRTFWWTPIFLIGLYIALALFALPTGPLLMGGAVFGVFYGTIYNLLGLLGGAIISYTAARYLGRDFIVRITGSRGRGTESFWVRHGFWPLVQTYFMPVPFAVINFGSALAGVGPTRFLMASLVGLAPTTLIHTFFISALLEAGAKQRIGLLAAYGVVFILFNLLLSLLWVPKWRHRN